MSYWTGAEGPIVGPKGPQPSAGTRNKPGKRAVFLVENNIEPNIPIYAVEMSVHGHAIQHVPSCMHQYGIILIIDAKHIKIAKHCPV